MYRITLSLLFLLCALISALVLLTLSERASHLAQDVPNQPDADADDRKVDGEEGEDGPRGLNPDRALPKKIPTWWVKAEKPSLDVKEHTLKNGMKVLLVKTGDLPIATSMVWYDIGARDEVPGLTGMAHFLEHMMFKGSRHYRKGEVDALTVTHGGSNNAFTSSEYTAYYFTFPTSSLEVALDIERDRMTTLTLDPKEFEAEKQVVLSESKISDDDPSDRRWDDVMRAIFGPKHPYSTRVLGLTRDVESMSIDDMRRFWEMYYTPDNATIVIAGGIETDKTLEMIKERFAEIPRTRHPRHRNDGARRNPLRRDVARIERLAEVSTPSGEVVFPSDSIMSIRNPIRDVLASVLTEGETSRLYGRLVREEQLCDSVYAYNYERAYGGTFHIGFSMREAADDKARRKVETIVLEELAKLASEGPTQEEVSKAIRSREVSAVFGRESSEEIANDLGRTQITYGDWRYVDHWLETLKQITPDDVRQVADDWDVKRDPVYAWLLPKDRETGKSSEPKAPALPVLNIQRHVFENGLELLMLPQPEGADVFSLLINTEAGVRTEPLGMRGLVELFGATLAAGTTSRTRVEIQKGIDELGGSLNASSSGISGRVLARDADVLLEICADILRNATFPKDEIERERKVLLAQIERLPDDSRSLARRALQRAVYGDLENPYAVRVPESKEVVAAITQQALISHYKHYIAPNNTRIVCVGRFDVEALKASIEKLFGGWKKVDAATDRRRVSYQGTSQATEKERYIRQLQVITHDEFSAEKVDPDARTIAVNRPHKSQVEVMVGNRGFARDHEDYYAARVLETILGLSPAFSDRFTRVLRDEMGLAYSTYAYMTLRSNEEPGMFLGYIGTSPEKVPTALRGMQEILAATVSEEVSDAEFETARNYLLSSIVFELEGSQNLAQMVNTIARYNLGWEYLQDYRAAISAVTKADLLRVARRWLDPKSMVTVVVGELSGIPDGESFLEGWAFAKTTDEGKTQSENATPDAASNG